MAAFGTPVYEEVTGFGLPPENPGYGTLTLGPDGYYWGTTMRGAGMNGGAIYKIRPDGSDWKTVYSFIPDDGVNGCAGPCGGLVSDGAGCFWGTALRNPSNPDGAVYKFEIGSGTFTTVARFNRFGGTNPGGGPIAGLVGDGAGFFWGTTYMGGTGNNGTVFKVNSNTGVVSTLVEFTGTSGNNRGSAPYAKLVSDGTGNFWGTTGTGGANDAGTVFKINAATGALTTIVEFTGIDGINKGRTPLGELLFDNAGFLWGTTFDGGANDAGTVFKINVASAVLTTVVEFGGSNKGWNPHAGLVSDEAGFFWGSTVGGGAYDYGTIYKIEANTGTLTTVIEFTGNGITNKGSAPRANLVPDGTGSFLGTTESGGAHRFGTIFKINSQTGVLTTLIEFTNYDSNKRGYKPVAGVGGDGGQFLWGTTVDGGVNDYGTLFKVDPSTGEWTNVGEFSYNGLNNKGAEPMAGLVSDGMGNLWGTASAGGAYYKGTIFKVNENTGELTTVVEFTGSSGTYKGSGPGAKLVSDGLGSFWGTTSSGGGGGNLGTIFKVDSSTGTFTSIAEFPGGKGVPGASGGLTDDGAGYFWGTTNFGGAGGLGTVFKVNQSTGELVTIVEFTGNTGINKGRYPYAGLVRDDAGFLWGTTSEGGAFSWGTVFKIKASTGVMTTVYEFAQDGPAGNCPFAGLANDGAGTLWGTTAAGGSSSYGTAFSINASTGALTSIVNFTSARMYGSASALVDPLYLHSDGNLYGTLSDGGSLGGGTVFRLRRGPTPITQPASALTFTSATLNARVNPNGEGATACFFEYSTDPDLKGARSLLCGTIANTAVPTQVSLDLDELSPGTTYYYRVLASNAGNSVMQRGRILSFTTAEAVPPVVGGDFSPTVMRPGPLPDYLPQAQASDESGIASLTQNPPAGTQVTVGIVTVTITARDGAGNEASTRFRVGVRPESPVHSVAFAANKSPAPSHGMLNGPPDDAVLANFGVPAIDQDGNVAFLAKWASPSGGRGSGLFTSDRCIGLVGGAVPALGGPTYKSFTNPVIDNGTVASIVTLGSAPKSSASAILIATPASGPKVIARAGEVATADGATFKSFKSVGVAGGYVGFLAQLAPGSGTVPKTTTANDMALFVASGDAAPTAALREGQKIGTKTIKTLVSFEGGNGSPGQGRGWLREVMGQARVLARVSFKEDKSQAIVSIDPNDTTNPVILSQSGIANSPGSPAIPDSVFQSYGLPAANALGRYAFLGTLKPGAGNVDGLQAHGIFVGLSGVGASEPLALNGEVTGEIGGKSAVFSQLKDPIVAADSSLAFVATIRAAGNRQFASTVWWQPSGGSLTLLAQTGILGDGITSDVPGGGQWKSFSSLALAADAGPIFSGTLMPGKGGVTKNNAKGVWALDATRTVREIFRAGDTDIAEGKTLKSFSLLNSIVGSTGVTRSFNDYLHLTWLATFTDNSQAIIVTEMP